MKTMYYRIITGLIILLTIVSIVVTTGGLTQSNELAFAALMLYSGIIATIYLFREIMIVHKSLESVEQKINQLIEDLDELRMRDSIARRL